MRIRRINESKEIIETINECFIDFLEKTKGRIHSQRDSSVTYVFLKPVAIRNVDLHFPSLLAYTDQLSEFYHEIQHCIEKVYTEIDRDTLELRTNPASQDGKEAICIQISLR